MQPEVLQAELLRRNPLLIFMDQLERGFTGLRYTSKYFGVQILSSMS